MIIQWYPGHMAKAKRMLQENIKLVDAVAEIVDARAPEASRNPDFDALFSQKERIILLNKADLADENATRRFLDYYRRRGLLAAPMVSTGAAGKKQAVALMERAVSDKVKRLQEKGIKKTVRVMVVGIPNVGKSTFINRIAGENRTKTGDTPGVTRSKQWVKVGPYLELMDSPGLLWPKLEDQQKAQSLAFLGTVNDDILDGEELASALLQRLMTLCPEALMQRYKKLTLETAIEDLLPAVAQSRGFLLSGGELDTERAARIVLDEFRGGKIARVTLDQVPEEQA
ncbi:MAG: ribosome biogenesis GTPase YlqF [Clostridia bacterium]|nr:ribosome biogenesis GTPase YlqF [Clostridia bacterium]